MNVSKWKLKGCPRCGGDIFISDDIENCLQCGYVKTIHTLAILKQPHGKGYARHNFKVPVEV